MYVIPQNITDPTIFHANRKRVPPVRINLGIVKMYIRVEYPPLWETLEIHRITRLIIRRVIVAATIKYICRLMLKLVG